jgi:hypothetical protein
MWFGSFADTFQDSSHYIFFTDTDVTALGRLSQLEAPASSSSSSPSESYSESLPRTQYHRL